MQEYKCCRYCEEGAYVPVERQVMCRKEGLVPRDHICPHFRFNPFKMRSKRKRGMDFSKFEAEDYSIES